MTSCRIEKSKHLEPAIIDATDITVRSSVALSQSFPGAVVEALTPFESGSSSITYAARVAGPPEVPALVVVKVAPPGLDPVRNRDVLRQARLLSALEAAPEITVPLVFGTDEGKPSAVPPLFVMSHVDGESHEPLRQNEGTTPSDDDLSSRVLAATDMLVALHRFPAAEAFLGEPVVSPMHEIDRWTRAFATVDPTWIRDAEACRSALVAGVPSPMAPAVLHGDWQHAVRLGSR
jgi:hypothetical protein